MTGPRVAGGTPLRLFLSGVQNPTHLLYAASYLRALLACTTGPVTLVDLGLGRFMGRANVTPEDLDAAMPVDPRLRVLRPGGRAQWSRANGERLVYIGVGAPGIKPYLRLRLANPGARLHVVVVDEGLGSYGDWRTRRDAWRREGGREPWPTVRALAVAAARAALTDERWALFEQHDGRWRLNRAVVREFHRDPVPVDPAPRAVVLLSQPWVELGQISAGAYLAFVQQLAAACAGHGLSLKVKAHPAEDAGRYDGFELVGGRLPAELDPDVLHAAVVVGLTSTALLNLAALQGIPALRVALPELVHLDDQLAPWQQSLLAAYLPPAVSADQLGPALTRLASSATSRAEETDTDTDVTRA